MCRWDVDVGVKTTYTLIYNFFNSICCLFSLSFVGIGSAWSGKEEWGASALLAGCVELFNWDGMGWDLKRHGYECLEWR